MQPTHTPQDLINSSGHNDNASDDDGQHASDGDENMPDATLSESHPMSSIDDICRILTQPPVNEPPAASQAPTPHTPPDGDGSLTPRHDPAPENPFDGRSPDGECSPDAPQTDLVALFPRGGDHTRPSPAQMAQRQIERIRGHDYGRRTGQSSFSACRLSTTCSTNS